MSELDPIIEALRDAKRGVDREPVTRIATVTGGTQTTLAVRFDGETSASSKQYARAFGPVNIDDRVVMLRTGSTWIAVCRLPTATKPADSGWITPTLLNGWQHFDAGRLVQYRKLNGIVYFRGIAKSGVVGNIIFELAEGFKPEQRVFLDNYFAVTSNLAFGSIGVDGGGGVQVAVGSNVWIDLCSVSYPAVPQ